MLYLCDVDSSEIAMLLNPLAERVEQILVPTSILNPKLESLFPFLLSLLIHFFAVSLLLCFSGVLIKLFADLLVVLELVE